MTITDIYVQRRAMHCFLLTLWVNILKMLWSVKLNKMLFNINKQCTYNLAFWNFFCIRCCRSKAVSIILNTYCFATAPTDTETCHNAELYVHCLWVCVSLFLPYLPGMKNACAVFYCYPWTIWLYHMLRHCLKWHDFPGGGEVFIQHVSFDFLYRFCLKHFWFFGEFIDMLS